MCHVIPLVWLLPGDAAAPWNLKEKLKWLHSGSNSTEVRQISCILTQGLWKYLQSNKVALVLFDPPCMKIPSSAFQSWTNDPLIVWQESYAACVLWFCSIIHCVLRIPGICKCCYQTYNIFDKQFEKLWLLSVIRTSTCTFNEFCCILSVQSYPSFQH